MRLLPFWNLSFAWSIKCVEGCNDAVQDGTVKKDYGGPVEVIIDIRLFKTDEQA